MKWGLKRLNFKHRTVCHKCALHFQLAVSTDTLVLCSSTADKSSVTKVFSLHWRHLEIGQPLVELLILYDVRNSLGASGKAVLTSVPSQGHKLKISAPLSHVHIQTNPLGPYFWSPCWNQGSLTEVCCSVCCNYNYMIMTIICVFSLSSTHSHEFPQVNPWESKPLSSSERWLQNFGICLYPVLPPGWGAEALTWAERMIYPDFGMMSRTLGGCISGMG